MGIPQAQMAHTHECPRCGTKWECGEANYQDECPYPTKTLCVRCWARSGTGEAPLETRRVTSR